MATLKQAGCSRLDNKQNTEMSFFQHPAMSKSSPAENLRRKLVPEDAKSESGDSMINGLGLEYTSEQVKAILEEMVGGYDPKQASNSSQPSIKSWKPFNFPQGSQ